MHRIAQQHALLTGTSRLSAGCARRKAWMSAGVQLIISSRLSSASSSDMLPSMACKGDSCDVAHQ